MTDEIYSPLIPIDINIKYPNYKEIFCWKGSNKQKKEKKFKQEEANREKLKLIQ